MYTIEVVTNYKLPWRKQKYHWRIKVGSGEIIAVSEQYYNYDDCYAVAWNLKRNLSDSKVVEL